MSLLRFFLPENAWLAADRIDRLKTGATVLTMVGLLAAGVVFLALGLAR